MLTKSIRLAIIVAAVTAVWPAAIAHAEVGVPIITEAEADVSGLTLSIHGQNFIPSPFPKVLLGTEAGGFQQLTVTAATTTNITALLTTANPGTYLLIVQFGSRGFPLAALSVAIGELGPPGPPGPMGSTGAPGSPGASVGITALGAGDAHCPNGGTKFTAGSDVSYACNGASAATAPRTCPAGYVAHGPALCVEDIDMSGLTFSAAANRCRLAGAHLPSSAEMRAVMQSGVAIGNGGVQFDWLDDQVGTGTALVINSSTDPNNMLSVATTATQFGRCFVSLE
jgi:hypothetical protein